MADTFANDFFEIPATLSASQGLREAVLDLIAAEPMPGKVTEGGNRLSTFREILRDLANGEITLDEAYLRTQRDLPRYESPHSGNNRVFADGWAERLVRIQFSRFYNQAVLEQLREEGAQTCFVPHSDAEDAISPCTRELAGANQSVNVLYQRLIDSYRNGQFGREPKIPNHPHCTHVVRPTT